MQDRFLRGRQTVYMIYEHFRVTGAHEAVLDYHCGEKIAKLKLIQSELISVSVSVSVWVCQCPCPCVAVAVAVGEYV